MSMGRTFAIRLPIEQDAYAVSTYELVPNEQSMSPLSTLDAGALQRSSNFGGQPSSLGVCQVLHKFRRVPNRYTTESTDLMNISSPYASFKRSSSGNRTRLGNEVPRSCCSKGTETDKTYINLTHLGGSKVPNGFGGVLIRCEKHKYVQDIVFERRGWRW